MSVIEKARKKIIECLEFEQTELSLMEFGYIDLSQISEFRYCNHVKSLILGCLPDELNPRHKIFDYTGGEFDLEVINHLTGLEKLSIYNNEASNFEQLRSLIHLIELRIQKCKVPELHFIENLVNLEILILRNNDINNIESLQNLQNLINLDLSNNQISDLRPLHKLKSLNNLNLSNNKIADISILQNLRNLRNLNLVSNDISDLHPISNLNTIRNLELSNNKIVSISDLSNLYNLECLELGSNSIENIDGIKDLINLYELSLLQNKISNISPLSELESLILLNLAHNKIIDISPISKLNSLERLYLKDNEIEDIRPLLVNLAYKEDRILDINISQNPCSIDIPSIVKQGYSSLKAYYDSRDTEGTIQNDQLKVILLGNSTAGKTSLVNYWGKKEFAEKQTTTHGIYTPMELPLKYDSEEGSFRVNVWDFGGQDYYHATHRLFVTRDSTYILVCNQSLENKPEQELTTEYVKDGDETKEIQIKVQHYPYRYWLQTLAFLTKLGRIDDIKNQDLDKTKLPKLFLVENKCSTYEHNQYMRLDTELAKTLPFEVINQDLGHQRGLALFKLERK